MIIGRDDKNRPGLVRTLFGSAATLGFTGAVGAGAYLVLNSGFARGISDKILAENKIRVLPASFRPGTEAAKSNSKIFDTESELKPYLDVARRNIENTIEFQKQKKLQSNAREEFLRKTTHIENLPENMNAIHYQVLSAKLRKHYQINKNMEALQDDGVRVQRAYNKLYRTTPRVNKAVNYANRLPFGLRNNVKSTTLYKQTQEALTIISNKTGARDWVNFVSETRNIMDVTLSMLNNKSASYIGLKSGTHDPLVSGALNYYNSIMKVSERLTKISDLVGQMHVGLAAESSADKASDIGKEFEGFYNKKIIKGLRNNTKIVNQINNHYKHIDEALQEIEDSIQTYIDHDVKPFDDITPGEPGGGSSPFTWLKTEVQRFRQQIEEKTTNGEYVDNKWKEVYNTVAKATGTTSILTEDELITALQDVQKTATENKPITFKINEGGSIREYTIHPTIVSKEELKNASVDDIVKIHRQMKSYSVYKEAQEFVTNNKGNAGNLVKKNEKFIRLLTDDGVEKVPTSFKGLSQFTTLTEAHAAVVYKARVNLDKNIAAKGGLQTYLLNYQIKHDGKLPANYLTLDKLGLLDVKIDPKNPKKSIKVIAKHLRKEYSLSTKKEPKAFPKKVGLKDIHSLPSSSLNVQKMETAVGDTIDAKLNNAIESSTKYAFRTLSRENAELVARMYGDNADADKVINELNSAFNLPGHKGFARVENELDKNLRKMINPKSPKAVLNRVKTMFNKLGVDDGSIKVNTFGDRIIISGKPKTVGEFDNKSISFEMNLTDGNIHFNNGRVLVTRTNAESSGVAAKHIKLTNSLDKALDNIDKKLDTFYENAGNGFSSEDIMDINKTFHTNYKRVKESAIDVSRHTPTNKYSTMGLVQDVKIRNMINTSKINQDIILRKQLQLKRLEASYNRTDRRVDQKTLSYTAQRDALINDIEKLKNINNEITGSLLDPTTIENSQLGKMTNAVLSSGLTYSTKAVYHATKGTLKPNIGSVSNRLITKGYGNLMSTWEPGYNPAKGISSIRNTMASPMAAYGALDEATLNKLHLPKAFKEALNRFNKSKTTRATVGIAGMEQFKNSATTKYVDQEAEVVVNHMLVNAAHGDDVLRMSVRAAKKMRGAAHFSTTLSSTKIMGHDLLSMIQSSLNLDDVKNAKSITIKREDLVKSEQGNKILSVLENTMSFNDDTDFSESQSWLSKNNIRHEFKNGKLTIHEADKAKLYELWNDEADRAFSKNVHQNAYNNIAIDKVVVTSSGIKVHYNSIMDLGANSKVRTAEGGKALVQVYEDKEFYEALADHVGITDTLKRKQFIKRAKKLKIQSFGSGKASNGDAVNHSLFRSTIDSARNEIDKKIRNTGNFNSTEEVNKEAGNILRSLTAALLDPEDMKKSNGKRILADDKLDKVISTHMEEGLADNILTVTPEVNRETLSLLLRAVGSEEDGTKTKSLLDRLFIFDPTDPKKVKINENYLNTKIYEKAKRLGVFDKLHFNNQNEEKVFLRKILDSLTISTDKGTFLAFQRTLKHSAESPNDLFRLATNQVRALGGVKDGVQVDLMSSMFLRMKGMNILAKRAETMAMTGRNAVQMYTANLLEALGKDPTKYLDADTIHRLGLGASAKTHLVLPGGHVTGIDHINMKELLLDEANTALTDRQKYSFLVTGVGYGDSGTAMQIDNMVSNVLDGTGDQSEAPELRNEAMRGNSYITQKEMGEISGQISDMEHNLKQGRSTISLDDIDKNVEGNVDDAAVAVKKKLESVNKMSSLLSKEELDSYRKFIKNNRKIKLPPGINTANNLNTKSKDSVSLLDFLMQPEEEIGVDYTKLNISHGGKALYALNDVHMAQVKLLRLLGVSTELEKVKAQHLNSNTGNISETEAELKKHINEALDRLYVAKLHSLQGLARAQLKPRLNGMQAIGHPEFTINQKEYNNISQAELRTLKKHNIITGLSADAAAARTGTIAPKIGVVGIDSGVFMKLIQNQNILGSTQAKKIADAMISGKLTAFAYNKREPLLSQRSYQSLEMSLYNMEKLKGSAAETKTAKEGMYINKFTAKMVEGDFDRDIYSMILSLTNGTYFKEQTEALTSYVSDHSMHITMSTVTDENNQRFIKYVFNADKSGLTGTRLFSELQDHTLFKSKDNKLLEGAFGMLEKEGEGGEALKNSLISANDLLEKKFAKLHGLDDIHEEVSEEAQSFISIIDEKGVHDGEYTSEELVKKLKTQKRSLAKHMFSLSDSEISKLTDDEIEFKLKQTYMLDTSTEYYNKLQDAMAKDLARPDDAITSAFNAFNIRNNIADHLEVDVNSFLAANSDTTAGERNALIQTMKKSWALSEESIANTNNLVDKEAVKAFTRIKQATGLIYNFSHGVVVNSAIDMFGVDSKVTKLMTNLSYVPQQINISAKHMLPAVAMGWMESVKYAGTSTSKNTKKIVDNIIEGRYNLKDVKSINPLLQENQKLIDEAIRLGKNEGNGRLTELAKRWQNNMKRHKSLLNQKVDENVDLTNFTTEDLSEAYKDRIEMNKELFARKSRAVAGRDIASENKLFETISSGIEKGKSLTTSVINSEGNKELVRQYFNEARKTGAIYSNANKFIIKFMSNRSMDFGKSENISGLADFITNKARSVFGDLFATINDVHVRKHVVAGDASKFMNDSLINKITQKVTGASEHSFTGRVLSKIDTSSVVEHGRIKKGGMAGAFMGALFGLVAAVGASSSKRRWLGRQTGVGGEAYDNNSGIDERRYSDRGTSEPTTARYRENFTPSSGITSRRSARLRREPLTRPRRSAKEQFKEIVYGNKGYEKSANSITAENNAKNYAF